MVAQQKCNGKPSHQLIKCLRSCPGTQAGDPYTGEKDASRFWGRSLFNLMGCSPEL